MSHTHTHTDPAEAGPTLKGKRKEKTDTNDGPTDKTAQGGREQTDLQNQPTRRNGPDKNRAHAETPRHITEVTKGHGKIRGRN